MTYIEFANHFLPQLATHYIKNQIPFHGLVDFDLWKKVFPDGQQASNPFYWNRIKFNAFILDDDARSLLIVYSIPLQNQPKEAQFIGIRLDNNRKQVNLYALRRPRFYDELWDVFQYNFETHNEVFIDKLKGTNSLREFCVGVQRLPFTANNAKPSLFDRIVTKVFYN